MSVAILASRNLFARLLPLVPHDLRLAYITYPFRRMPTIFLKLSDYKDEGGFKMPDDLKVGQVVRKARNDNLKTMRPEEYNGNRDTEGFTCHQRLQDMKTLHLADPKRWPIPKSFYRDLQAEFKNTSSPVIGACGGRRRDRRETPKGV